MNWINRILRRVKHAVIGKPKRPRAARLYRVPSVSPRPYPSELGLTAKQILQLLSDRPMTRVELSAALKVTTASIHLPRLRDRGLVVAASSRNGRFLYSITNLGMDALRRYEVSA